MDILDQEAEEDEAMRTEHSAERVPSHEVNREFIEKAQRYRNILGQAAESDEVVRSKWDEWERNITELTWDESQLEQAVPSSTISFSSRSATSQVTPARLHSRNLRALLESLDDVTRNRADIVKGATQRAESDNITPRILKTAANFEQWAEIQPSMFEDVIEEELARYEKFRIWIEESEQKQDTLLASIKEQNAIFLQSRKDDPAVKEREHALQSLDLAYHKYKEITRNLDEGLKFYNDFAGVLAQFRDACKDWANARRHETQSLTRSLESISLHQPDSHLPEKQAQSPLPHKPRTTLDLPPPDSDEWEAMTLPPGPPSLKGRTPRGGKRAQ